MGLLVASSPVDDSKHMQRLGPEVVIGERTGDLEPFLSVGGCWAVLPGDHGEQDGYGGKRAAAQERGPLSIRAIKHGGQGRHAFSSGLSVKPEVAQRPDQPQSSGGVGVVETVGDSGAD